MLKNVLASYSNLFLYISFIFVVLALGIFGILQTKETESLQEKQDVSKHVHAILENGSQNLENKLNTITQGAHHISGIEVYDVKNLNGYENVFDFVKSESPRFEYSQDLASTQALVELLPSGNGDGGWYVITERKSFHTLSVLVLMIGFILYWILFSMWSLGTVHVERKLNVRWALILVLFNVIGYLFFVTATKNSTTNPDHHFDEM